MKRNLISGSLVMLAVGMVAVPSGSALLNYGLVTSPEYPFCLVDAAQAEEAAKAAERCTGVFTLIAMPDPDFDPWKYLEQGRSDPTEGHCEGKLHAPDDTYCTKSFSGEKQVKSLNLMWCSASCGSSDQANGMIMNTGTSSRVSPVYWTYTFQKGNPDEVAFSSAGGREWRLNGVEGNMVENTAMHHTDASGTACYGGIPHGGWNVGASWG